MQIISAVFWRLAISFWAGKVSIPALSIAARGNFDMPPPREKLLFQRNLRYHAFAKGIGFRNGNFRGFPLDKQAQKPSLDCSGPGCRIISA
jgi:hypothetical protein